SGGGTRGSPPAPRTRRRSRRRGRTAARGESRSPTGWGWSRRRSLATASWHGRIRRTSRSALRSKPAEGHRCKLKSARGRPQRLGPVRSLADPRSWRQIPNARNPDAPPTPPNALQSALPTRSRSGDSDVGATGTVAMHQDRARRAGKVSSGADADLAVDAGEVSGSRRRVTLATRWPAAATEQEPAGGSQDDPH